MRAPALALIVAAACSRSDGEPPAPPPVTAPVARPVPPRPAELVRVTIKALGMYCEETCPTKVRDALAGVPGIYELGFDLSKESVFVSYDAAVGTPKAVSMQLIAAIKGAGFDPWMTKQPWPADAKVQVVARAR